MQLLPTFKGYLVDEAMQRFRKVARTKGEPSEYIPFDSPQGKTMYEEFIAAGRYAYRKLIRRQKQLTQ